MLDCLVNYIGLMQCYGAYDASDSGQYINTLPGITLESIDKIADTREQRTYRGVWDDVQENAKPRFYSDVISELTKCFQLDRECDYETLICDNITVLTNAWKLLLGNQLMIERIYSNRLNRYTTVGLEEAKELKDHYQVEYEKALAQAVKLMDVTDCEFCCGGNPESQVWLP